MSWPKNPELALQDISTESFRKTDSRLTCYTDEQKVEEPSLVFDVLVEVP